MSENFNINKKYTKEKKLFSSPYSTFYKGKDIFKNIEVIIEQIDKIKYKTIINKDFSEKEIEFKTNDKEIKKYIKEQINEISFYYIIYIYCSLQLDVNLKIRNCPFSIDEIKYILKKLNNNFDFMYDKFQVINGFSISNICLPIDNIENYEIIYSGFRVSSDYPKDSPLNSDEIFKLGEIIYYMLFLNYPFENNQNINNEVQNLNERLDTLDDENLKDLIRKMLDMNNIINWNEYIQHPFFFELKPKYYKFNIICKTHSSKYKEYCLECKKNICIYCKSDHQSHKLVEYNEIGYTDYEIYEIIQIIKCFDRYIDNLIDFKKVVNELLEKIKKKTKNKYIFENDENNNFKNSFLQIFNHIKKEMSWLYNNELFSDILNINFKSSENFIIAEIDIKETDLNKKIQILNHNIGLIKKEDLNNIGEIYINEIKIDFSLEYKFNIKGIYTIKYKFKKKLKTTSSLFFDCSSIISIDLSNFDSSEITSMDCMFANCTSLNIINFSNFDTSFVTDMGLLFYGCINLKHLDLSNFKTKEVTNMSFMFGKCYNLKNLNFLPSFTTISVQKFTGMFYNCISLIKLDLSKFITSNAITLSGMFEFCTSLLSLDISNFRTNDITDLSNMFANCSLPYLDLSNFVLNKNVNLSGIFSNCEKMNYLKISEFKIIHNNEDKLKDMFKGMNKKCIIESKDNIILQKWNEYIKDIKN